MYKGAIQEKRFEYKGFPCVVVMQALGFRTGYVGIPKGHKLFNVDYCEIDVSCHGGLTYSESYLVDQTDDDIWWIGFDCGHYMDGYDLEKAKELFAEYPDTIKQIDRTKENDIFGVYENPARSLEYVEENLKQIVEQIL